MQIVCMNEIRFFVEKVEETARCGKVHGLVSQRLVNEWPDILNLICYFYSLVAKRQTRKHRRQNLLQDCLFVSLQLPNIGVVSNARSDNKVAMYAKRRQTQVKIPRNHFGAAAKVVCINQCNAHGANVDRGSTVIRPV